ncbi:MAG: hypothetical protein AB7H86_22585 [Blastocatellales bacterium]
MSKPIFALPVMIAILMALFWFTVTNDSPLERNFPEGQDAKSAEKNKIDEEVELLIERARNAPPEIAADLIFQLLEANIAISPGRKIQLLEELFDLSYNVQHNMKLREAIDIADSRIGNLNYAYTLNLDSVSIQCRVVRLMIPIKRDRAVELFKRIQIPDLDPLTCQDLMGYDISIYYDALRDIVSTALTDNENKQIEVRNLIGNAISGISSPLQFGAVAKMLATLDLTSDELSYFVPAFVAKLKNLSSDPRSLSMSMPGAGAEISKLAMKCRAKGVVYESILDGYRTFLVENMTKSLCNDYSDTSRLSQAVTRNTNSFNNILKEFFPDGNPRILPLKAGQLNPKIIERSPPVVEYTKTPSGVKLLDGIRNLNFDTNGEQRTLADKEKPVWKNELLNYYNLVNSIFREEGLSDIDNFHNKCAILGTLLQFVPQSNPMYDDILKDYISFISQNRTQQENVIEWLWQARVVLLRMKLTKQSPDSVLKALSDSGDELLKLIAETRLFIAKNK